MSHSPVLSQIGKLGMRRRDFITVLAGAAGYPHLAGAQQKAMPVIGLLSSTPPNPPLIETFRQGLSEAGYVEGKDVIIEYRWAEGHYDRLPALAADLIGRKVDVIFSSGTPAVLAAKRLTSTIPIVFTAGDPVGDGLIASLSRPGGNLTGVSIMSVELVPKQLDLLSELVPDARLFALLVNPNNPNDQRMLRDMQAAARIKGVQLQVLNISTGGDLETGFASLVQQHVGAVIVGTDAFFNPRREQLAALAARHAIPAMYYGREFAAAGGLISYGASLTDVFRQVGGYVGRVLGGAKPADMPVQQPTKFELVINLKTAKALGLTISKSILARADEVIE
jgi:putative tryptophan/tyrosine transport system substrate-binding protein